MIASTIDAFAQNSTQATFYPKQKHKKFIQTYQKTNLYSSDNSRLPSGKLTYILTGVFVPVSETM